MFDTTTHHLVVMLRNQLLYLCLHTSMYTVYCFYNSNPCIQGLSLINGTQFITAIGAEAVFRAELITRQADVIAAFSLEVLQGTPRAFDAAIHASRPHPGQQAVASRLRALLDSNIHPSEIRCRLTIIIHVFKSV